MSVFRSSRLFLRSQNLASLALKVRFSQSSATSGATVQLVETQVDWASVLEAHPARVRGRKFLAGSQSPNFPEFLAPPKDGYVQVFTPAEKVDCSPEHCAPSMQQVICDVLEKRKEGALLFRGLPLASAEDFSRVVVNLGLKLQSYRGGGGIRHRLTKAVDTASDEPPELCIEPHHELAYTDHYPEKTFLTEDKSEVEEHLKAHNIHWEWYGDGSMKNWTVLPAMHKYRGDLVWFTDAHSNNSSYTKTIPYWADKDLPDDMYPQHTYYGDGTDIEPEVLQHIRDTIWQGAMGFQLQKGDLHVLNNIYCQHARLGFTGKRNLAVALAMQDQDYPEDC